MHTGVDSLGAMELRSSLTNSIGCTLPTTLLYDHQSPAEIAAFISKSLEEQEVGWPRQGWLLLQVAETIHRSYGAVGQWRGRGARCIFRPCFLTACICFVGVRPRHPCSL